MTTSLLRLALSLTLSLGLAACGGDSESAQRAAVVGTWEVRWPAVFKVLRAAREDDPAARTRWLDRLDRAEKQGWSDRDLRLDTDGGAEFTDGSPTSRTLNGTWTLERRKNTLADWTVTVRLSQPGVVPSSYSSTYYWNGRFLFFARQVDGTRTEHDSIPVQLSRSPPSK